MSKIRLILEREYMVRVRKKSFIVMTLLGPLLMVAMIVVPVWLTQLEDTEEKRIAVLDNSDLYAESLSNTTALLFEETQLSEDSIKAHFIVQGYFGLLVIPDTVAQGSKLRFYSEKQPAMSVGSHITYSVEKRLEEEYLKANGIELALLQEAKQDISVETFQISKSGDEKQTNSGVNMAIGFIGAIIIYMFIFIYGAQIMRGVIEEKTSRIVEIIVSSVKPFELMMGKIIGVSLVVVTQIVIWVVLSATILFAAQSFIMPEGLGGLTKQQIEQSTNMSPEMDEAMAQVSQGGNEKVAEIMQVVLNLNFPKLIGGFVFFFLGGYLLYASIFAAIGSAVDNETDSQQFMIPVSIPLVLAFIMAQPILQNPDGALAFWFSIIPFTSPIVMMVLMPFDVPLWQIALSAVLLIITFIGTTWLAGRIYRTGILMYGKKVGYKDLYKWLFLKN